MLQRPEADDPRALIAQQIATDFLTYCTNNPLLRRNKITCLDYIHNNDIPPWNQLEHHNFPAPSA